MDNTPSMIGRQREITRLTTLWERARTTGQAQWGLVGGDAGMGKTTLISTFVESVPDAVVLNGNCLPMGGAGIPYAPIVGWMRALIQRHGADRVRQWAGPAGWETLGVLLPGVGAARPDGDFERLQLSEAVTAVLERAAAEDPLLIVLEDLHWADATTAQLTRFLKSSLSRSPLVLLGTWRTDELHRRHPMRPWLTEMGRLTDVARFELDALDDHDSAALVRRTTAADPSPPLLATIVERAEGIPFFIEELAHSAELGPELPWTLRDALMARVHHLDEDTQRLLRLATGAGTRVDHRVLAAMVQTPDSGIDDQRLDSLLRQAMDASLLTADEQGYCFRHALLAEAIHDDLLPGEHTRLHARYAALLAEHPDWDRGADRARHLFNTSMLDEAFEAAVCAARSGGLAQAESLSMLTKALEIWDRVTDAENLAGRHDEVLAEAAELARFVGEMDRGLAYIDASIAEAEGRGADAEVLSERLTTRGRLLSNLMREGALETMHQAVQRTEPLGPGMARMRALEGLSAVQMLEGDFHGAEATAAEAVAITGEARNSPWYFSVLNTHAVALVSLGQEERGLTEMASARPTPKSHQVRLRYWINHSNELELVGRFAEAADLALEGIAHARTIGREWTHGSMLIGNAAWPLLELGRWREADALLARPRPLSAVTGSHQLHLALMEIILATWKGETSRAEALLTELAHNPRTSPQRQYRMQYAFTTAMLALALGRPESVPESVAQIWDEPERHKGSEVSKLAMLAAWAARESSDAAALAALRSAIGRAHPTSLAPLWSNLIDAEERDDIAGWESAARTAADPRIPRWVSVHVDEQRARHLLAARDRSAAGTLLDATIEHSERIGWVPATERLRALRERAGLGNRATGGPADPAAPSLTPRETEVLALIGDGKANRQIGEELFISTKTVSVHVTNIMAKFGVGSRGAAAARARELNLL